MILSKGTNQFPDNKFSFWSWSAPVLQSPEEVLQKLKELQLEGRIVKDIIAVGLGYNWTDDSIDDMAYNAHERLHPILRNQISQADALFSSEIKLECSATIDQPILIVFEDDDVLGISFDEGSSVRMELNTIPVTIEAGINCKNFHANRLFRDIIGKTVSEVWVNATSKEPEFTGSHGMDLPDQPLYICDLMMAFHDQTSRWKRNTLRFQAWLDYGSVALLDEYGDVVAIPITEVPKIVEDYPAERLFQTVSEKKAAFLKRLHIGNRRK